MSHAFPVQMAQALSLCPGTVGGSITLTVQASLSLGSGECQKCPQEGSVCLRNISEPGTEKNLAL